MIRLLRTHYKLLGTIALLVAIGIALYLVPPAELVALIGVENAYLVTFLVTLLAGVSSFTATAAVATVAALAQGGGNPVILGLLGGFGLFLSDSIFYFLIWKGSESVREKGGEFFKKFEHFFSSVPTWLGLIIVYLYTGFSPFPNDLLLIALLLGGYRYRTFAIPLFLGAVTLMLIITHVGGLGA